MSSPVKMTFIGHAELVQIYKLLGQDLNGFDGIEFLEFGRCSAVSRSQYLTPHPVKEHLTFTPLELVALEKVVTLLKLVIFLKLVTLLVKSEIFSTLQGGLTLG